MIIGQWGVGKAVKLYDTVLQLPYVCVAGVKDMRAIFMHLNTILFLTVYIASEVITTVYDKTPLASLLCFIGESGAKEPSPNNQIVEMIIHSRLFTI